MPYIGYPLCVYFKFKQTRLKSANILWPAKICNTQSWVFFKPTGLYLPTCTFTRNRMRSLMGNKLYSSVKAGFPVTTLSLQAPELGEEVGEASVLHPGKISL